MVRKLLPCLFALALGLSRTPAHAQAPAETIEHARELFVEGSKLAETGDWEGARDRFERSLAIKRAALTLYNLGIAQQETGHLVAAVESFHAFLAMPVEAATQGYVDPVRAVVATLEARLSQVDVDVRPAGLAGVVVRIDGRETPPGPRKMDPGHHDFSASAPGFCDASATATLVEGARATIALRLGPDPIPAPAPSVTLPVVLSVSGLALLVGGGVTLGAGAARGLRTSADPGAAKVMLAGGVVEGAGALALGAAALLLLTRAHPRAPKTAIVPWASGPVGGLALRF